MSEEDLTSIASNRPSVISLNDVTTQSSSRSGGLDSEKELEKIYTQVRFLENENLSLRRAIPRFRDVNGADVTSEMTKLCAKLAEAEENVENWEAECAAREQALSRQRQEFFRQIELKENKIREISERAKVLEDENFKLRVELENDQSRMYHLANKSALLEESNMYSNEFNERDLITKLRQDFNEKIAENAQIEEKMAKLQEQVYSKRQQLVDMQLVINQQSRTIDAIFGSNTDAQELLEKMQALKNNVAGDVCHNCSDDEYIVKHTLGLYDLLKKNQKEMKDIKREMVKLLRRYGHNLNDNDDTSVGEFNDGGDASSKQSEEIRNHNILLQNKIVTECDNSALKRHLDALNADTMGEASSMIPTNNAEQLPNHSMFGASFADIMRNTTNVDFLNRTTQDVGVILNKMNTLKQVCSQLFENLRSTAGFLERLLETIGESEEGHELLAKIMGLKLEFDKSVNDSRFLVDDFKKTEKSLVEFCDLMGQTFERPSEIISFEGSHVEDLTSPSDTSKAVDTISEHPPTEESSSKQEILALKKDLQQLSGFKEAYDALQMTLKNELEIKESLNKQVVNLETDLANREAEVAQLSAKISDLEDVADGLHQVLDQREEDINAKAQLIEEVEEEKAKISMQLNEKEEECVQIRMKLSEYDEQVARLTEEIDAREKLVEDLKDDNALLHQANVEADKLTDIIRQKHHELEERFTFLSDKYRENDELIDKTNKILYAKISEGFENIQEDESIAGTVDKDESLLNLEEFSQFLNDCHERSNRIVQLLKRADGKFQEVNNTMSEAANNVFVDLQIPYFQNLLTESRSIRLMLYKIARFFESQKENNQVNNKKIVRDIRAELAKIYDTLKSVQGSSIRSNQKSSVESATKVIALN